MKIGIIGAGYVGLVTGVCLADLGHQIWFLDKDKRKISLLKKGVLPIVEPELEKLLLKAKKEKRINFASSYQNLTEKTKIWFVCVGTPPAADGSCNMAFLFESLSSILKTKAKRGLIIVKSTTDPLEIKKIISLTKNRFQIAFVPEFLREGTAVKDFFASSRLVFGVDDKRIVPKLKRLHRGIKGKRIICSPTEAALIKCASNVFLTTKISFANLWALLCDKLSADVNSVMKAVGLDPRIGQSYLAAGLGIGGSCLPKDTKAALAYFKKSKIDSGFFKELLAINEKMTKLVLEKVKKLKVKRVTVWGLTFKPDTDDLRDSRAVKLLEELNKLPLKELRACDPAATGKAKLQFPRVKFFTDPYASVKNTDIIILATEWDIFVKADFKRIAKLVKRKIIIDGRSGFEKLNKLRLTKLGFKYLGIGR